MGVTPLAEVYEELKELRRRGGEPSARMQSIVEALVRSAYPRPDCFSLLAETLTERILAGESRVLAELIRALEIKTLADRVFGDQEKADAWLCRPNGSLSGQQPIDLLKDELGAAVVREALEQIDHGIFA